MAIFSRTAAPKRVQNQNMWWEETEEAPRAGIPDKETLGRKATRYRWAVWIIIVIAPIALLGDLAAFTSTRATGTASSTYDQYDTTRSVAILDVRQWLSSNPAPIPGGILIGWDKATSASYTPPTNGTSANTTPYTIETHTLTVADNVGRMYQVQVQLANDTAHGPSQIGNPSIVEVPAPVTGWKPNPYPNATQVNINSMTALNQAVSAWAAAYAPGNIAAGTAATQLQQAVGDTNNSDVYLPLLGYTLVPSSVTITGGYQTGGDANQIFVTVTASILYPGQVIAKDAAGNPLTPAPVSYDLLVNGATTAAPHVVAWGGPGTGPSLSAYQNAFASGVNATPGDPSASALPNAPKDGSLKSTTAKPKSNHSAPKKAAKK